MQIELMKLWKNEDEKIAEEFKAVLRYLEDDVVLKTGCGGGD